jgi:hypothetical protein
MCRASRASRNLLANASFSGPESQGLLNVKVRLSDILKHPRRIWISRVAALAFSGMLRVQTRHFGEGERFGRKRAKPLCWYAHLMLPSLSLSVATIGTIIPVEPRTLMWLKKET